MHTSKICCGALVGHDGLWLPITRQVSIFWGKKYPKVNVIVDCCTILRVEWLSISIARAKIGEVCPIDCSQGGIGRRTTLIGRRTAGIGVGRLRCCTAPHHEDKQYSIQYNQRTLDSFSHGILLCGSTSKLPSNFLHGETNGAYTLFHHQ